MTAKLNIDLGVDRRTIQALRDSTQEVDGIPVVRGQSDAHRWGMFHLKEDAPERHTDDHGSCMRGSHEDSKAQFDRTLVQTRSAIYPTSDLAVLRSDFYEDPEVTRSWPHP